MRAEGQYLLYYAIVFAFSSLAVYYERITAGDYIIIIVILGVGFFIKKDHEKDA